MTSGYTPIFASMFDGTLHGRWPAAAVFATLLPLANRYGKIDMSLQAIAGRTGWPQDLLETGIRQLMEPDPGSRSSADEGRRLVLLDPHLDWGWRVVNHSHYREKARKQTQQIDATEAGRDAERKRIERESKASSDVQRCPASPAMSGRVRPSDSDSDSDKSKRPRKRGSRLPEDFRPDLEHAQSVIPDIDAQAEAEKFCDYWKARSGSGAIKEDWPATWRNWIRTCRDSGRYARAAQGIGSKGMPCLNG